MVKKFKKITSVAMSIAIAVCCSIATVNVVKGEMASIKWTVTVSTGGSQYTNPRQKQITHHLIFTMIQEFLIIPLECLCMDVILQKVHIQMKHIAQMEIYGTP